MNIIILIFLSCFGDSTLSHEVEKIVYEDREVIVEVEKEIEVPIIVIKEVEVLIEDTDDDAADVWVENFIQPTTANGVDILWVIDPSGSMHDDAPQILSGITAMMNALPLTGWRLAIIPADWRYAENVTEFPLLPGDTPEMAETMYNNVMSGAFEAGFDASYGYIMNNSYAQTWLRPDAAMLVVFVSDEEEQSQSYFNSTSQFITWYSSYRESVFLASIVHIEPAASLCNHAIQLVGKEYIIATTHFSGQVIDICSEDWSAGVFDATNQVSPYEYWDLVKTPLYNDRIYVFIDGVPNMDWHYEPSENRVYFDVIPDARTLVEIAYYYE